MKFQSSKSLEVATQEAKGNDQENSSVKTKRVSFSTYLDIFEYESDNASMQMPHFIDESFRSEKERQQSIDNKWADFIALNTKKRSNTSHMTYNKTECPYSSEHYIRDQCTRRRMKKHYRGSNVRTQVVQSVLATSSNFSLMSLTVKPGRLGIIFVHEQSYEQHRNAVCTRISDVRLWSTLYGKVAIGDQLLAIDHWDVSQLSLEKIKTIMRHTEGRPRTLVMLRANQKVRNQVPLHSHSHRIQQ